MDYTNLQVQTPIGIGVLDIRNAAAATIRGGRVEYGPSHLRWTVGAYTRNLTNTDYVTATFGTPPNAYAGRPGPSRQFAVEFSVRR